MSSQRARLRFELRLLQRAGLRHLPVFPEAPGSEPAEAKPATPEHVRPSTATPAEPPRSGSGLGSSPAVPPPPLAPPPAPSPQRAAPAPELPPSPADRQAQLEQLAERIRACDSCKLCAKRTHAVPGEGALDPPILFIGEGPGRDEDHSGRPFVGRAGQLLDKMIGAIGLQRSEVFIANIVKCRPPANRTPEPDEIRACLPYIEEQITALQPRLICTLGLPATRALVPKVGTISSARGRQFVFRGIPLIPTFHPAYLLRNPSAKRQAWADLKVVARLALGKDLDR